MVGKGLMLHRDVCLLKISTAATVFLANTLLPLQVQTILEYRNGLLTWIAVGIILLFTAEFCLCCLAIIPLFINELKDVYHISPTDGSVVGVYKRLN